MALKIVYPICCGIDVHKTFVVACIASTIKGVTTYKRHRFSTYTKGLNELSQSVARKQIKKTPNGLLIYLSMTLWLEALCHHLRLDSCVTLCAIVLN